MPPPERPCLGDGQALGSLSSLGLATKSTAYPAASYTQATTAWRIRWGAMPLTVFPKEVSALAVAKALAASRPVWALKVSCGSKKRQCPAPVEAH